MKQFLVFQFKENNAKFGAWGFEWTDHSCAKEASVDVEVCVCVCGQVFKGEFDCNFFPLGVYV